MNKKMELTFTYILTISEEHTNNFNGATTIL